MIPSFQFVSEWSLSRNLINWCQNLYRELNRKIIPLAEIYLKKEERKNNEYLSGYTSSGSYDDRDVCHRVWEIQIDKKPKNDQPVERNMGDTG